MNNKVHTYVLKVVLTGQPVAPQTRPEPEKWFEAKTRSELGRKLS